MRSESVEAVVVLDVARWVHCSLDEGHQRGPGGTRPFDKPQTGQVAVKVINDYGDEVMKVFGV